ncbi:MAG: polysaccharide deacetylase family protein [Nitrospiraceae bacterium]
MKDKSKGQLKSFVGQSVFWSGISGLLLSEKAVVITFHRVNNSTVGDGLTCGVEKFKAYCRFFARHFHVVSLSDLIEKLENDEVLTRQLVITFDDGYRDNYEHAAPVLKEMGLPATFFVVSQFIGSEIVPWWDRGLKVRQSWMTWNNLRGLQEEGFEIGVHTRSHVDLGKVSGEQAWQEIHHARVEAEDKLSSSIDLFAYPFGGRSNLLEANRRLVQEAGYRCCCSCYGGVNAKGTDPFALKRIAISPWYVSPFHFGFELALDRTEETAEPIHAEQVASCN